MFLFCNESDLACKHVAEWTKVFSIHIQIQFSNSNLLSNISTNYWHAIGGFALFSTETLVSLLLLAQLIRGLLVVPFPCSPNEDFFLCFLGDLIRIWRDISGGGFMCSMQNMSYCSPVVFLKD